MDSVVRTEVIMRANDLCEGCRERLHGRGAVHHRQRKGMGGPGVKGSLDYPANLMVLHTDCHTWAHSHPTEARRLGWIVATWDDPTMVPIVHRSRP